MNLGELRTAVENVVGQGSVSDVVRHFNSCLLTLASTSREIYTQDVAAVNGEFMIPANVLSIYSMFHQGFPITWQHIEQNFYGLTGTTPISAYKSGNNVVLFPTVTCTVTIFYKLKPEALATDADIPEIPDADNVLINYAIWQIFLEEENPMAVRYEENYLREERNWQRINSAANSRPKRIKLV